MHAVDDALPVSEIEFDGHVTHKLAPAVDEYEPAGHTPQASLLRVALNVPVWQIAHVPEADAP
jgi:hypothetical protein